MKITYFNKNIIDNKINIHDSIFRGFNYDDENKTLLLKMNNYCVNKVFTILFYNVLILNCEMCQFWGKSPNVLEWRVSKEETFIKKIIQKQNSNKELSKYSLVDQRKNYIETIITLTSGDTINIVCEYIEFEEIQT